MTRFLDLVHPDAGTVLISEWLTGTAGHAETAADAILGEWAAAPTPPGRLAQHVFLATDGTGLLFYAQWTGDDDHMAWVRGPRGALVSRVDTLVPGIERPGLNRTRRHPGVLHDAVGPAGVFVVSAMAAEDAARATLPAPGLLGSHVHVTTDGRRAIVFAEWADTAAHTASLTASPGASPSASPTAPPAPSGAGGDAGAAPAGALFKRYTLHPSFQGGGPAR